MAKRKDKKFTNNVLNKDQYQKQKNKFKKKGGKK
jgi:hypothetical protein